MTTVSELVVLAVLHSRQLKQSKDSKETKLAVRTYEKDDKNRSKLGQQVSFSPCNQLTIFYLSLVSILNVLVLVIGQILQS